MAQDSVKKRVLVTGATGFVGSNLATRLIEDGHEVYVTGRLIGEQRIPSLRKRSVEPKDISKLGKLDTLYHQAAITDTLVTDEAQMFRANVHWPTELFQTVISNGCKNIVYASSTAVYGNSPAPYKEDDTPRTPLNAYGKSKVALENVATDLAKIYPDVVLVGLRYCNVYGPGENHKGKMASMVYQLAQQMIKGNPRIFKDGEQKRDYIYVGDVVEANLLASQTKESCIVNCGFGMATTFNRLIKIINNSLRTNRTQEYFDNPSEKTYQNHTECDMTLAKEKLGFESIFDIETGIRAYYKSGFLTK